MSDLEFARALKRFLPDAYFEGNDKRYRVRFQTAEMIAEWYRISMAAKAERGGE